MVKEVSEMNQKERVYDYMRMRTKTHTFASIVDVPILILLWYLNYKTGFWIVLVLLILNEISMGSSMLKYKRALGLMENDIKLR